MSLRWSQVLAWRLRRQLLDPIGTGTAEDVVARLGAVPAYPAPSAELAVGVRRTSHRLGDVERAVGAGRLIRTYAFRGATHLLTPEDGGIYLAVRASSRMWERSSWRSHYDLEPSDWPDLRACVRDLLADGPLTRRELGAALARRRRFRHLRSAIEEGNDTLIKPMAWQGDLCFGPLRGESATFQRLDAVERWPGLPELEEAGPQAVEAYVRAYGPATVDHLHYWLSSGLGARSALVRDWVKGLGERLTEVDVEGEPRLLHRDDVEELTATAASPSVRLLPAYDQWVLGPGTADPHVVPPAHRTVVSRGAQLVVSGGVVVGTWTTSGDELVVSPFDDAPEADLLDAEVVRIAGLLGRPLATRVVVG